MQGEQEPEVPFTQVRNDTQWEREGRRLSPVLAKLTPRAWEDIQTETLCRKWMN